jgi:hypothetical protein
MTLTEAVLSVMMALSPERSWTSLPGHTESVEARRARYAAIANDVVAVGKDRVGAALILAVAFHESGFAHDVDEGRHCYRGPGYEARCDSGRAVCMMQLQLPRREREEARTDRRVCFSRGLAATRRSLATCAASTPPHRFAGLSGSCSRGLAGSRRIFGIHRRAGSALEMALVGGS